MWRKPDAEETLPQLVLSIFLFQPARAYGNSVEKRFHKASVV
jgi:hypothetical protein